jgi:hypothetical protein
MNVTFRCDPALAAHLPRPCLARKALPDWLRTMPAKAYSDLHGSDVRTVKQCPPFVDAMAHGFMMPLACDVRVADGTFTWDWDLPAPSIAHHPRSPLSFHGPAQTTGAPFHVPDQVVIKFNSFWTVELDPGWSLFATHPANRLDLPFRLVSGLVDADRFNDVGIFFPALWVDPGFEGVLPRGTPVAQCFPVSRDSLELTFEPMDRDRAERYDRTGEALLAKPGVYRRRFRARRRALPVE